MISEKVKNYIAEQSFCSDYLFKDWETFLKLLYEEGGRISAILWWDHCKKAEQHLSVGGGGYTDLDDSEYIYAETQLYENGFEIKALEEIIEHIMNVIDSGLQYDDKYVSHELVPSFFLMDDKSQFQG